MDELHRLAVRLGASAGTIAAASGEVDGLPYAPDGFGVDAPGLPGELGRALHGQWAAALDNRQREARRAVAYLADAASGVGSTARAYADTDDVSGHRFDQGAP